MQKLIHELENKGLVLDEYRVDIDKKSLDLSKLELTEPQYEIIIGVLSNNIDLAYLNLSSTNLDYGHIIELIDAVTQNDKLTCLDFSNNAFGNDALRHLVSMLKDNTTSLNTLNLAYNVIGELGTDNDILRNIEFLSEKCIEVDLTGNML